MRRLLAHEYALLLRFFYLFEFGDQSQGFLFYLVSQETPGRQCLSAHHVHCYVVLTGLERVSNHELVDFQIITLICF